MKSNRLTAHFSAAAAVLTATAAASAEVVVWQVNQDIPLTIDGLYVKVDTQQTTGAAGSTLPGWDFNPYGATYMSLYAPTAPTGGVYVRVAPHTGATNLPEGYVVGPTSTFGGGGQPLTTASVGQYGWQLNALNYFGFRFNGDDAAIHYGFAAIQVGATSTQRQLVSVSYETTPATPITVGPGGPPPAYDPCAAWNPVLVGGNNSVAVNQDTAQDLALGSCGVTAYKANYYKYVAPWDGSYTFSTCASIATTRMAVLDGCQAGANQIACDDSACGDSASVSTTLTSGQIVYVVIGNDSTSIPLPSPISVDVTAPPPPPNPNCATAEALVFGDNAVDNGTNGGDSLVRSNATTGTATIYKARWYKFTPTVTGMYTFVGCGSANDTKLALAAECPEVNGVFNSIAYNDDSCACASGCGTAGTTAWSSKLDGANVGLPLTQELVAGQTYMLLFGAYAAATAVVSTNLVVDGPPQTPPCLGDFNGDGARDGSDLTIMLAAWGTDGADLDGDGTTGGSDLTALLAVFNVPCP